MAMSAEPPVELSHLDTERSNPATREIDKMSPLEIAQVMNAEDAKVSQAIALVLPQIAQAITEIAARLRQGGRLIYMGAGTSGRLGVLDASECPPTFSISPDVIVGRMAGGNEAWSSAAESVEDSAEAGRADAEELNITAKDALVGIAASGRTPYVLAAIDYANQQGALTIGLACNTSTPLEKQVSIMLAPVVGPEVLAGSTRLKAGTAQKMVLNMLSTGTMILLGKTFGNLMVDVKATNYKLHQRALQIIQQATGADQTLAEELLQAASNEVKTAIVMKLTDSQPEEARAQLATHHGMLRAVLGEQL